MCWQQSLRRGCNRRGHIPYLSGDQLHQQHTFTATDTVATIAVADIDAAGIAVVGVAGVALDVIAAVY